MLSSIYALPIISCVNGKYRSTISLNVCFILATTFNYNIAADFTSNYSDLVYSMHTEFTKWFTIRDTIKTQAKNEKKPYGNTKISWMKIIENIEHTEAIHSEFTCTFGIQLMCRQKNYECIILDIFYSSLNWIELLLIHLYLP